MNTQLTRRRQTSRSRRTARGSSSCSRIAWRWPAHFAPEGRERASDTLQQEHQDASGKGLDLHGSKLFFAKRLKHVASASDGHADCTLWCWGPEKKKPTDSWLLKVSSGGFEAGVG